MKFSVRFPLETIGLLLILTATSYFYLLSNPVSQAPSKLYHSDRGEGNGSMSLIQIVLNNFEKFQLLNLSNALESIQVSDDRGSFSLRENSLLPSASAFQENEKESMIYFLIDTTAPDNNALFQKWEHALSDFQVGVMGQFWGSGLLMRELEITSNLHLMILCVSYLLMNMTLYALFLRMKSLGSSFALGFNALINGAFALVFALLVTRFAGISFSFTQLMDALPFLVCTVGFEKSVTLTKAVMEAVSNSESSEYIRNKISGAVAAVSWCILSDGAFEVAALLLASFSGPKGIVADFCLLSSAIVAFDCLFLFTYFASILTLKVEVMLHL
jgi:hydroxymethylglutaryl-CoA reductase (NADPH)